jgi:hypothetical protein
MRHLISRPAKQARINFHKGNRDDPATIAIRSKISTGNKAKRKIAKLPWRCIHDSAFLYLSEYSPGIMFLPR